MKQFALLIICLTTLVDLNAQRVTVSEELALRNDRAFFIVGRLAENILIFRDRPGLYEVEAYDKSMRSTWNKSLEFERKQVDILEVVPFEEHFFVIYKFRDRGNSFLRVNKYDAAAERVDSAMVINFGNTVVTPSSRVVISENRETILIYQRPSNSELEMAAFSLKEMKGLWPEMVTLTNIPFGRDYEAFTIGNNGRVYYVMEQDNRRFKLKKHRFTIYTYGGDSNELRFFEVPLESKLSYDVQFKYDNVNGYLIAMGLYAEKNLNRAEGYYMMRISDADPGNDRLSFEEFGPEVINVYEGANAKKSNGIVETDIQEIILRQDGGAVMFAEYVNTYQRPMITGATMGLNGRRFLIDYNYEDVIAISIHPDGTPHWETVLHKKQYSQDDDASYSSFFLLKTPKALRLLYNDEIRNDNTVSEYIITGRGDIERNAVLSTENQDIRLQFRDALQIAGNEILVPSLSRRRLKLVHIVF